MTDKEQRIISALSRGAILTARQITDRIGGSIGGTRQALERLYDGGHLICWKAHPDDREYLWATDDPKYPTIKI